MKSSIRKRISGGIRDFLTFSRSEQRGLFVLLVILFGLLISNQLIPAGSSQKPIDFSAFEKEIIRFENEWQSAREYEKMSKGNTWKGGDTTFQRRRKPDADFIVELNGADTFDLMRLRGIGPSFARRIVSYRNRLGGFIRKEQLLEVFGMDSSRYRGMLPNLAVVTDSVRKLDLNNVTFKEMLKHPYFPFEMTKAVMLYRQKNKRFRSTEELKNVEGVNDSVFRRVIPYLKVLP